MEVFYELKFVRGETYLYILMKNPSSALPQYQSTLYSCNEQISQNFENSNNQSTKLWNFDRKFIYNV